MCSLIKSRVLRPVSVDTCLFSNRHNRDRYQPRLAFAQQEMIPERDIRQGHGITVSFWKQACKTMWQDASRQFPWLRHLAAVEFALNPNTTEIDISFGGTESGATRVLRRSAGVSSWTRQSSADLGLAPYALSLKLGSFSYHNRTESGAAE